jgi:hypothetical protein
MATKGGKVEKEDGKFVNEYNCLRDQDQIHPLDPRELGEEWARSYDLLRFYTAEHSRLPSSSESYRDFKIGEWVCEQQHFQSAPNRLKHRIVLERVPYWAWEPIDSKWFSCYVALLQFIENNKRLPKSDEMSEGKEVGYWIAILRHKYKKEKPGDGLYSLTNERVRILEAIPIWTWSTRKTSWERHCDLLREFVEKNKRLPTPIDDIGGIPIGRWVVCVRRSRKGLNDMAITEDRAHQLEWISGWTW